MVKHQGVAQARSRTKLRYQIWNPKKPDKIANASGGQQNFQITCNLESAYRMAIAKGDGTILQMVWQLKDRVKITEWEIIGGVFMKCAKNQPKNFG